jgi:hypothetical protein
MSIFRVIGLVLVVLLLLTGAILGIYAIVTHSTPIVTHPQADPVQTMGPEPALAPAQAAADSAAVNTQTAETAAPIQLSGGVQMTQTFALQSGWNTIYLELEPDNPSPLINAGTDEDPYMVHEKSTIEALFDVVTNLECILAWNVPLSPDDYVDDLKEAGLVQPSWRRYIAGADGASDGCFPESLADNQDIPPDLVNLHANQGYLVRLADGAEDVMVSISGQPQAGHRRWIKGSYSLAGFPIPEGITPKAETYFANSPITEVYVLKGDGTWQELASFNPEDQAWRPGDARLNHGQAYLVYYDDQRAGAPDDFGAPLHIADYVGDGLQFGAGAVGVGQTVRVENRSNTDATIEVRLTQGEGVMALYFEDAKGMTNLGATGAVTTEIEAGDAQDLTFSVHSREQSADGAAILEIRSDELATRWQIPVTAESGSHAGLWVGEVVVNDVSESRLGATNVDSGTLTIALAQQNGSGLRGAAEFKEITGTLALTITLALPDAAPAVELKPLTGIAPYVGGYVFEDLNQNGQRDVNEPGFKDVEVRLSSASTITTTKTLTEGAYVGAYVFEGLAPGTYKLESEPQPPEANYTSSFTVSEPLTVTGPLTSTETTTPVKRANTWPQTVTVTATKGYSGVVRYSLSDGTTITPTEDVENKIVQPLLNFGYVSSYDARLTGGCGDDATGREELGQVINGILVTTREETLEDLLDSQRAISILGADDKAVACGEIAVGSPTGPGNDFTFRLLLWVDKGNNAELLPYYKLADGPRISSAAFSMPEPQEASSGLFTDTGGFEFDISLKPEDPLNPFKHKYHPDHDNLDAKFNPIPMTGRDGVASHLWEAPLVKRHIALKLTDDPPGLPAAEAEALAKQVNWGGATWGGTYQEVIEGLHDHDITVKGYFVIRHVLAELEE